MTAVAFLTWNRSHTSVVGAASICVLARYASVRWAGVERLDRRFAELDAWRAIAGELELKLPAQPLAATSPIARLLAGERLREVQVQYVTQTEIDDTDHGMVAKQLDEGLRHTMLPETIPNAERE